MDKILEQIKNILDSSEDDSNKKDKIHQVLAGPTIPLSLKRFSTLVHLMLCTNPECSWMVEEESLPNAWMGDEHEQYYNKALEILDSCNINKDMYGIDTLILSVIEGLQKVLQLEEKEIILVGCLLNEYNNRARSSNFEFLSQE